MKHLLCEGEAKAWVTTCILGDEVNVHNFNIGYLDDETSMEAYKTMRDKGTAVSPAVYEQKVNIDGRVAMVCANYGY